MTLMDKCKNVVQLINAYEAGRESYATVSELRAELVEFSRRVTALEDAITERALFIEADMGTFDRPDVSKLRIKFKDVAGKLAENPRRQTLVQSRNWSTGGAELERVAADVAAELAAIWESVRKQFRSRPSPDQVAGRMAPTVHNQQALEEYRAAYRYADEAIRSRPRDRVGLAEFQRAIAQTDKRVDDIEQDVPDVVAAFLKHVASPDGAPLADLSPAVLEWLDERSETVLYRVFPRRKQVFR